MSTRRSQDDSRSPEHAELGRLLRVARGNISQREIAAGIGKSPQWLAKLEHGAVLRPDENVIKVLCDRFGLNPDKAFRLLGQGRSSKAPRRVGLLVAEVQDMLDRAAERGAERGAAHVLLALGIPTDPVGIGELQEVLAAIEREREASQS